MIINTKKLIIILITVILVMGIVMAYLFLIKPAITNHNTKLTNEGVALCVNTILNQLQNTGYVQIPLGNQTLYLAPIQKGS